MLLLAVCLFVGCKKLPDGGSPEPEVPVLPSEEGLLTFTPAFPTDATEITIRFDSNKGNTELKGHSGDIYAHIGVITQSSDGAGDWQYVKTEWDENTSANRMNRISPDSYELKLNPRAFFGVPSSEQNQKVAMVFRNADGTKVGRNADGSDIFMPIYAA